MIDRGPRLRARFAWSVGATLRGYLERRTARELILKPIAPLWGKLQNHLGQFHYPIAY